MSEECLVEMENLENFNCTEDYTVCSDKSDPNYVIDHNNELKLACGGVPDGKCFREIVRTAENLDCPLNSNGFYDVS